MAIINLRKHYYPIYTKDTFIEVPDDVVSAPVIKCKKTPRKKCSFMAERRKKR